MAYGHNRIEACRKAGVTEAELEVIDLHDYDMLCCMVDENLTQQHIEPKTIFEIVAAAIKEAEKMLRETTTVYEFNALFKNSRGLPSLLRESNRPVPDECFSLEAVWKFLAYAKRSSMMRVMAL